MPVAINSIKFWINAFIPATVKGYTLAVPGHTGLTMIPGPTSASDCYHTDQRDFSNNIHASSRMHSEATVQFGPGGAPKLTQWHNCDETVECDCEDGDEECRQRGNTSGMSFTLAPVLLSTPKSPSPLFPAPVMPGTPAAGVVVVQVKCAAHNPCAPSSALVGDIDCKGTVTIDVGSRSIECDLMIDEFPAFEAYATINGGAGVKLFRVPPPGGNTVMNLPGPPTRRVHCKLRDANGDGVFDTHSSFVMPAGSI